MLDVRRLAPAAEASIKLTSCLFTSVAFAVILSGVSSCERSLDELVSPEGTYRVVLSGDHERPEWGTAEFRLYVNKGGHLWIDGNVIYSAQYYDTPFPRQYPMRSWDSDTVLRLSSPGPAGWPIDEVLLRNQTQRRVRLVDLSSGDKLLVFDLEPGRELRFNVPYNDISRFVRCKVEFEDGSVLDSGPVVFGHDGKVRPPVTLAVTIEDSGVTVSCLKQLVRP